VNALTPIFQNHLDTPARNNEVASLLDKIGQVLGPTEAQCQLAEDRYKAAGSWVSDATDALLRGGFIFAQGSFATGTVVRPINEATIDVDLIYCNPNPAISMQPSSFKKAVGDRLREHGTYRKMLEEKPRCWRLNYASECYLDITPSIPNDACWKGGLLVPDKAMRCWKESNPKGVRNLFNLRAKLKPVFRLIKSFAADSMHSSVEPFPDQARMDGYLRRTVQLAKRSRDIYFKDQDRRIWPISIILTTLAARSYEWCVQNREFNDELELLCAVVKEMPGFIETSSNGPIWWAVWNETTEGENFAEKWNTDPACAEAFFAWHTRFMTDLERLRTVAGMDVLRKSMADSFGPAPVTAVFDAMTSQVSAARAAGKLMVAPGVGLIGGTSIRTGVRVNTFYGSD
jgi:hypothetical protein